MIHRKLQNVVYMKKVDAKKKKEKEKKRGEQHLKKKKIKNKGSNIGSCPQVPVDTHTCNIVGNMERDPSLIYCTTIIDTLI